MKLTELIQRLNTIYGVEGDLDVAIGGVYVAYFPQPQVYRTADYMGDSNYLLGITDKDRVVIL